MDDLQEKGRCPSLEEIESDIGNPVFARFCSKIRDTYQCVEKIEYSSCSWERGWNIKYKKAGKTLCTIYPRKGYFTVLAVVGAKEKTPVEEMLPECSARLQELYHQTQEGNGQRWLMIDIEDEDDLLEDVLRIIQIRRNAK